MELDDKFVADMNHFAELMVQKARFKAPINWAADFDSPLCEVDPELISAKLPQ